MINHFISIAVSDCLEPIEVEHLKEFGINYIGERILKGFSPKYRLRHTYRVNEKNLDYFKEIVRKTEGLEKVFIYTE